MEIFGILFLSVVAMVSGQDCSSLLGSNGKRFILDTLSRLPREIRAVLPSPTEAESTCRFDLTNMNDGQKQTLKTLYEAGYAICVGCGYKNADHGRCHSIDVCRSGSKCISGKNSNYQPDYYWHGCCDPSDSKCVTEDKNVHFDSFGGFNLRYNKVACSGPLCNENGYTQEKNDLINYLKGTVTSVNGNWGNWGSWSACDKSCDIGSRTRSRTCTSPAPSNGGKFCEGDSLDVSLCNEIPC